MPPAEVLITAGLDELEVVVIANRRAIDQKVLQENLVLRLLVIESEVVVSGARRLVAAFTYRALPHGRATAPLSSGRPTVSKFKQSTFDFRHAAYCFQCPRRRGNWRVILIAEQMLDVVNQKFLMLHFMLESQPQDCPNRFRVVAIGKLLDEGRHLFIDVRAIGYGFRDRRA